MRVRDGTQTEAAGVLAPVRRAAVGTVSPATRVLDLQRSVGNAATRRLIGRELARRVATGETDTGAAAWTSDQVRSIQRELRRLRLYSLNVDGRMGFGTEQGLTEAFVGEGWRTMDGASVIAALTSADRPRPGRGHRFRYGAMFGDGVLDVTFAAGYAESQEIGTISLVQGVSSALEGMGFEQNDADALEILATKAGRSVSRDDVSTFWVKRAALIPEAIADFTTPVDVVVRVVASPFGDSNWGAQAADAFRSAIVSGDVVFYGGHGRYGSGPDFDRNFARIDVTDENGSPRTLPDYDALEFELRREGARMRIFDPWRMFERKLSDGSAYVQLTDGSWLNGRAPDDDASAPAGRRLVLRLSNAGNVWLNDINPHANEFGGRLIYWALAQDRGRPETGPDGTLAAAAGKDYRVLAFIGCRTQDYERALRATPGLGAHHADLLETTRTISAREGFVPLLTDLMAQTSAEQATVDMTRAIAAGEHRRAQPTITLPGIAERPPQ